MNIVKQIKIKLIPSNPKENVIPKKLLVNNLKKN
jgi:hypothetical protein